MNVMSKELWEKVQDLLPIETDVTGSWSIGSANSRHKRVYGVCHLVLVDIRGVEITGPVIILEGDSHSSLSLVGRGSGVRARNTTIATTALSIS